MLRALLFDIDNTLLYTGGAGGAGMSDAFRDMFGVENGFAGVEFSGRSDLYILEEGLRKHGIEGGAAAHMEEFVARYLVHLERTLRERDGRLMPGFPELLDELSGGDVRIGLATGNFSRSGRLKLEYFSIERYFEGGGFGEESTERPHIVRAAIERVADGAAPSEVMVIGDTPHDITSALENGAVAVGVATGNSSAEELRETGAHLVFEDFSDWRSAAEALRRYAPA
jgi:phosphoglycolate phosphatase